MDVLGQVGEQCEVTERPDDGNGVVRTDFGEQRHQFGAIDLRTTDSERLDTGSLDQIEHIVAGLLSHYLSEYSAEKPDVFAQWLGGLSRCFSMRRGFSHHTIIDRNKEPRSIGGVPCLKFVCEKLPAVSHEPRIRRT